MAVNHYSFVLLAALTLINLDVCACRGVESSQRPTDLSSLLDNSDVRKGVLNAILHSQGSSADQIQGIVLGSNGNVEQAVNGINAELNENILRVDGATVRINADALRNILRGAFQSLIHNSLSSVPAVASVVEDKVAEQIDAESPQFNEAVEQSAIPLDVAQRSLVVSRTKRSEPLGFDLMEIINNIVLGILRDQFGSLVLGVLENLKAILEGNLILVAPGNPIGDFLAGAANFVIKSLLEIITIIEESLSPQVVSLSTQARRKRDLLGDITDIVDDVIPGDVIASNGGLLDVIVGPILTLLASVVGPLNVIIKGLIATIAASLEPLVGSIITVRVVTVINAILDLLIPTNPI